MKLHLVANRNYFESHFVRSAETWSLFLGRLGQCSVQNIHILIAVVEELFGIPCELLQWNAKHQRIVPWIVSKPSTSTAYLNGSRNDAVYIPSIHEANRYPSFLLHSPVLPFCILQVADHFDSFLTERRTIYTNKIQLLQQQVILIHTLRLTNDISVLALHARRAQEVESTRVPPLRSADIVTHTGHRTRQSTRHSNDAIQRAIMAEEQLTTDLIALDQMDAADELLLDE